MADLATMLRSGEGLLPGGQPLPPLPSDQQDSQYSAADVQRALRREQFIKQFGIDPDAPDFQRQAMGNFASQAIPQIAFSAMGPLAGPAGKGLSALLRSGPGKAALAGGGATLAAAEASPAEQATNPNSLESLHARAAALQEQTNAAHARRESERRSGTGPKFDAADAEYKGLNTRLEGLNRLIKDEAARNSPEARLAAEQARILAAEENRKRDANTPFKERHPDAAAAIPYASAGLAALLGAAMKGRHISTYNNRINNFSAQQGDAVARAQSMRPGSQRTAATTEAEGLGRQFQALEKAGPSSRGTVLPGAVAGEVGQMYPIVSDYSRAQPGSTLEHDTLATMKDPLAMGGRIAQGLAWGAAPAKIGSAITSATRRVATPTDFSAATAALRAPGALPPAEAPQSMLSRLLRSGAAPQTTQPQAPPTLAGQEPQRLLPAPANTAPQTAPPPQEPPTGPSSSGLSTLLRTPTQGQLPAPPASSTLEPVAPVRNAHGHVWVPGAGVTGRWQDPVTRRFLSGPPPKTDPVD